MVSQLDRLQILPEDRIKFDRLLSEAKRLAAGRMTAADEAKHKQIMDELDGIIASVHRQNGNRPTSLYAFVAGAVGELPYDPQSWREIDVKTALGTQKIRYHAPLAIEAKGYSSAFQAYLSKRDPVLLGGADQKALQEGIDTAGGFAVDEQTLEGVIRKMAALSGLYSAVTRIPAESGMVVQPRVNYTTDDEYSSPVRFTWTGELPASQTTARVTDPVFGSTVVPLSTALASCVISNDLLEDIGGESLLVSLLSEAWAAGLEDAILNGSGAGQPEGILHDVDGAGPVSVASGTSAAITTSGDAHVGVRLNDLYYSCPSQYWTSSAWAMNAATIKTIENLADMQDRPLIDFEDGAATLKGRPVLPSPFVPDIAASSYPIVFGDFSGYRLAERVGMSVRVISEASGLAEQNMSVVLGKHRCGGSLAEPYRLKVLKAGA